VTRKAWLTPDSESGILCRSLSIPEQLLPAVLGALGLLTYAYNWEEFGDMTPEECAELATGMWDALAEGSDCMIGRIDFYATTTLPDCCLACDGATYLRVDYPILYSRLDSAFVTDADHFVAPPVADRFILAVGAGSVGDVGGETEHTLSISEMPAHDHTIPGSSCFPYGEIPEVCVVGGVLTQDTGETGDGDPHNNMPPYIRFRAGIVAK
jgi:microcystin-dependent protein